MEELSKTQIILLALLLSFVTSTATALVTATLIDQAPKPITQTISRVIEKNVRGEANEPVVNETTVFVSDEDRIIEIVDAVSPAVVSIIASKDVPKFIQCSSSPFERDDIFNQFFPEFTIPGLCQDGTEKKQVSSGSGFFVSSTGLIATNKHVVSDTDAEYTAVLNSGNRLPVKVLARDPFQDLAVLSAGGKDHPYIALGNESNIKIGKTVIAIGNALGEFDNTVSVGVISGLKRTINAYSGGGFEELRSLIQTDAAINPGNSGGPLLTLSGKVVGINTAVATGAENIGFALPVNLLQKDLSDIEKTGRIVYPFLGVRYAMITEDVSKENNLKSDHGALLVGSNGNPAITPGSAAEEANLEEGDIILEVNGEEVNIKNNLASLLQKYGVGDEIELRVLKNSGDEISVKTKLKEFNT